MPKFLRKTFFYFAAALCLAGLAWAVSFGTLPPADFTFDNGTEIKTVDPAKATGSPENRIINALFEGLLRNLPPQGFATKYGPNDNVPLTPQPAAAERYEVSEDGKVYTFHMRPGAIWSDGSPVTSEDFAWSWQRMLHPETASEYAYQLYYIVGAEPYNSATVVVGDPVEIELTDRPDLAETFPRGTIVRGKLDEILKTDPPKIPASTSAKDKVRIEGKWQDTWVYLISIGGKQQAFAKSLAAAKSLTQLPVTRCLGVLPDFEATVGLRTPDKKTLVVTLKDRTPYFNELVAFYPLYPVNRRCIETHGSPNWTKPQNLVGNGPYRLKFRRIRDRIRLTKSDTYWDAKNVKTNIVDALAVKSGTTALNMYLNDQLDWATTVPIAMIPEIKQKFPDQFHSAPMLTTYFYRLNVNRPPLDNPKVRRALNLAIDKQKICEFITKAGQLPATTFVPPGLTGYQPPDGGEFNVKEARRILAEAGYPGGSGMPKVEIVYNTNDAHQTIAEVIQQQWRTNLGVDAQLRNVEWGVFLDTLSREDYTVARSAWVADYPDPNTFLDMFVTGGANNQTGWSNPEYDALIQKSASEPDPKKRMQLMKQAETILMQEQPIIPIYFYVSINLVKPRVKNFFLNVQDLHPLTLIEIDPAAAVAPAAAAKGN
jgi:oligopeptide transport system substrate-binding protein